MKIQSLTIHNIASIEDATIDFSVAPLCDTDIFLITGVTGAGKTTILDAICLALFNTTPRLSRCDKRKVMVNQDNITAQDPRNIVRLNTGYASVNLSFAGTDGNDYRAEWSVQRGKKHQLTTQFDSVLWVLHNLTTEGMVTGSNANQYPEVRDAIASAIGMDFVQFCRTTMLAQGQFTEFLQSGEEEKAVILEKITNTDIFSRLGAQIYTIIQAKDKAYKEEEARLAQITLLSEEETDSISQQLTIIAAQLSEIETIDKDLDARRTWLTIKTNLLQSLDEAQQRADRLHAQVDSEEFRRQQQRLYDWLRTTEVRAHIADEVRANTEIHKQQQIISELRPIYLRCISGYAWQQEQIKQMGEEINALETYLREHQSLRAIYEQAQTICADLRQWGICAQKITQFRTDILREQNLRAGYEQALQQALQTEKACVDKVQNQQTLIEKAKSQLPNLEELYKRQAALTAIAQLKQEMADLTKRQDATAQNIRHLSAEQQTCGAMLEEASRQLQTLCQQMEERKDTVEQWAKDMRAKLLVGCTCPVCMQVLQSPLPDEAELDSEYNTLKTNCEAQQKNVDSLRNRANDLVVRLRAEKNTAQRLTDELTGKQSALLQHIRVCQWVDNEVLTSISAPDLRTTLLQDIAQQIEQGNKQKQEIEAQEQILRRYQQEKDNAVAERNQKQNALTQCITKIDTTSQTLQITENEQNTLSKTIAQYPIDVLLPNHDWHTDTAVFIKTLTSAAQTYMDKLAQHDRLQNRQKECVAQLGNLTPLPANLPADWQLLSFTPASNNMLSQDCATLHTEMTNAVRALSEAERQQATHSAEITAYLALHTTLTRDYLVQLNTLSQQDYNIQNQEITSVEEQLKAARLHLEEMCQQQQQHLLAKPTTAQDTDILSDLQQQQQQNKTIQNAKISEQTLLRKRLADNEENKKRKGDTSRLEKLREEHHRWLVFDKIASADGKTFRNIAQSMILDSLLDGANTHLHRLDPRYTLRVVENSLNLKLEDAYQGFATRSTNTISGGESFLVSLALALALADFGQNLGVSTLFIDEGFGTLSGTPLNNAINLLKSLHSQSGTQVGIISHREEIKEKIDVQIQVSPVGNASCSTIQVVVAE